MKRIALFIFVGLTFGCSNVQQVHYNVMQQGELSGPVVEQVTGKGIVIDISLDEHMISISHGPIPAMNWPPMLMKFKVEESISLNQFKKGDRVLFDLDIDAERNFRLSDIRSQ